MLAQHQGLSVSHTAPPACRLGVARSGEGTRLGEPTPTDHRDVPDHTMLCSAIKAAGGKKRKAGGDIGSYGMSSQVTVMCDEALGMAEHLPADGK